MVAPFEAYYAVNSAAAWIDRTARIRLAIAGPDRARFLNNLATNDVKHLTPGQGCEAFVTSPQGKTLGHVTLLVEPDRILLRSDPAALEILLIHFHKYGLFDDVAIADVTSTTFECHVAGPKALDSLNALGCEWAPEGELEHGLIRMRGSDLRIVREQPTGRPGWSLIGPLEARQSAESALGEGVSSVGGSALDDETFETLRIEAGTPVFGLDITAENLPQEIGRDARAINYVKGCYLGQETVARLDALGHVNKVLKGICIPSGTLPARGTELLADGKAVGRITSAARSPGWRATVALAFVRATHAHQGRELTLLSDGVCIPVAVRDLPMLPEGARPT